MTCIIGFLCRDGAVVAADGVTTEVAGKQEPYLQTRGKKVAQGERYVVGASGFDGMLDVVEKAARSSLSVAFNPTSAPLIPQSKRTLVERLRQSLGAGIRNLNMMGRGSRAKILPARYLRFDAIVAVAEEGRSHLFSVTSDGIAVSEATAESPICVVGSSTMTVRPLLEWLRRVAAIQALPTVHDASRYAYAALRVAIDGGLLGVGDPITVVSLMSRDGGVASQIDSAGWKQGVAAAGVSLARRVQRL